MTYTNECEEIDLRLIFLNLEKKITNQDVFLKIILVSWLKNLTLVKWVIIFVTT